MNITEYQEEAAKTSRGYAKEVTVAGNHFGLLITALGLVGEAIEFTYVLPDHDQDTLVKEAGDWWWYANDFASRLNVRVADLMNEREFPSIGTAALDVQQARGELLFHTMKVSETLKKMLGHGHLFNSVHLQLLLEAAINAFRVLLDVERISLEQVARTNIDKLRKRYGKKFSSEASLNRKE